MDQPSKKSSSCNQPPVLTIQQLEQLLQQLSQQLLTDCADRQESKQQFVDQHLQHLPYLIRLFQQHCCNQQAITEENVSLHLLAKLSELRLSDACEDVLLQNVFFISTLKRLLDTEIDLSLNADSRTQNVHLALVFVVNLTRQERLCSNLFDLLGSKSLLQSILSSLAKKPVFDRHGQLITAFLLNLTQLKETRVILISPDYVQVIAMLFVAYANEAQELQTRLNLFGCIKNLSFETSAHHYLLNNTDLVVKLIWPITGPTSTEMDEEDNEQLPLDLQFLGEDKLRTENDQLKKVILESLLQLCALSESREKLRQLKVYFILRGYHRVETNKEIVKTLEDVVDIFIRYEEDYREFPNLHKIEINPDLKSKFDQMDQSALE